MNGFAATIEIRAARPPWALLAMGAGILLAVGAVLITDLPGWLRLLLTVAAMLGGARELRATRRHGIAEGVGAIWLTASGDWSLVLDTGELRKAELLHRQGFVTRSLVGLTLRTARDDGRGSSRIRVWLTPGMIGPADWRRLQVRLRNP